MLSHALTSCAAAPTVGRSTASVSSQYRLGSNGLPHQKLQRGLRWSPEGTIGTPKRQAVFIVAARRDEEETGFSPMKLVGPALSAIETVTEAIVKVVPDTVPRSVVDIGVKGGLALVVLGFARSLLSVAFTVGLLVLGLYIASQVLGGDKGSDGGRNHNDSRRGNSSRRPSGPQKRQPSVSMGDDLSEVWYDDSLPRWRQQSCAPRSEELQRRRPLLIDAEWEDRQQQPRDRAERRSARPPSQPNFGIAGQSAQWNHRGQSDRLQ